jgi:hypothetical protein
LLAEEESHQRPSTGVWLPVFSHPVEGEPRNVPNWDGSHVEVSSVAAAKLAQAVQPYVLRFGHSDRQGRLRRGDLILISQSPGVSAELKVVRFRRKCFLARQVNGKWIRAATGKALPGESVVVGHCVGVLWSALT